MKFDGVEKGDYIEIQGGEDLASISGINTTVMEYNENPILT